MLIDRRRFELAEAHWPRVFATAISLAAREALKLNVNGGGRGRPPHTL
jgi:hypothetical protein